MLSFLWRDLVGNRGSRPLHLLASSLFLGVLLIAACTGLLALIRDGIAGEERQLFGGDVELDVREPLDSKALAWISDRGTVSRLTELRTMLGSEDGGFTVVELQSVDENYPLYGDVQFEPAMTLLDATEGFGAAIDPVLAIDLGLVVGDTVSVADTKLTVRALIRGQPDRALTADVRGPPVLVSQATLEATGLVTPTSLVDYEYRVRLEGSGVDPDKGVYGDTDAFRRAWRDAFSTSTAEVNTVEDRNDRVSERLNEVAAVLLLIAVATLLVGGLGVANGVAAWLHSRREDLATLSAIGARDVWRARFMVIEVLLVSAITSGVASLLGASIAFALSRSLAGGLPVATSPTLLVGANVHLHGVRHTRGACIRSTQPCQKLVDRTGKTTAWRYRSRCTNAVVNSCADCLRCTCGCSCGCSHCAGARSHYRHRVCHFNGASVSRTFRSRCCHA